MGGLGSFLAGVIGKLAADEAKAWLPTICNRLMNLAVRRLPDNLRDRFSEEWAADLAAYPGEMARVLRALGFLCASLRIAGFIPDPIKAILNNWSQTIMQPRAVGSVLGAFSGVLVSELAMLLTRGYLRQGHFGKMIISFLFFDVLLSGLIFLLARRYLPRLLQRLRNY